MQLYPFCSWSCQSSVWHLPYVFRRKFTGFLSSCSLLYPCERVMLLLSAEASFKPGGPSFWEFASKHLPQRLIFGRPFLTRKGCGYPIFCTELSVGIIGIYGISSHTFHPYIHQLLLHTDTVLQAYTLIECLDVYKRQYKQDSYGNIKKYFAESNHVCLIF